MVGTWVGNNNSSEMKSVASGITGASPIWRQIIDFALTKGYNAPPFEKPEGIEEIEVDAISGYPSHDGYPTRKDFAIKGTVPALPDPVHSKLKVCKGENKLATDAKVVSGDYDEKEYIVLKENDPFSIDGKNRWQDGITTWINSQTDDKYKPPTDYCGDASETVVKLDQPQNEHKYDSENIDVSIIADSGDGIEKVELWVNGSLKETINSRTYQGKVSLPAGRYELFAKAKSRSGKEVQSGTVRIGTGGKDWQAPASAAPSPSPSPSPSASPIIILPSPTP